jgi:predicted KAP-like P-loop ATPase
VSVLNNGNEITENQSKDLFQFDEDLPISNKSEDDFSRAPFAERIANVIMTQKSANSIVFGLFGEWGSGKSSLINLIEYYIKLDKEKHINCIRYNPWRYQNEDQMLINFFETLASVYDENLSMQREIGKLLEEYGRKIATFSFFLKTFTLGQVDLYDQEARETGQDLQNVDVEDLKDRIVKILTKYDIPIVIFIDDIDRLDKTEIQSMFKIIKLIANFPHTRYVLAFDYEMVAAVLGEKYGTNKIDTFNKLEAGRSFIDKIIQIPIHLPVIQKTDLDRCFGDGVDKALSDANIELTLEEINNLYANYSYLKQGITNIRIVKRYTNSLLFSIPALKGEVNVADLVTIEGVRIIYPDLYEFIRNNKKIFTIKKGFYNNNQEFLKQALTVLTGIIDRYDSKLRSGIKLLLIHLFPPIEGIFKENFSYANDFYEQWEKDKNISSEYYFDRYFLYGVPEWDLSCSKFNNFITLANSENKSEYDSALMSITANNQLGILARKLNVHSCGIPAKATLLIAITIQGINQMLRNNPQIRVESLTSYNIGSLQMKLVDNIPKDCRLDYFKTIVECGDIDDIMELYFLMTKYYKSPNIVLSVDEDRIIRNIIVDKIRKESSDDTPIFIKNKNGYVMLSFWAETGYKDETNKYMEKVFTNRDYFIKFLGDTPFTLDSYEMVNKFVRQELIIKEIHKIYGDDITRENINSKNMTRGAKSYYEYYTNSQSTSTN